MSNKALALKYRPKRFSDLIGQESISQTLRLGLKNDKLSHAYLFSGLRGSGKTSTARIFAKALACEKTNSEEPCNVCEACLSADEGRHLDIIEMDAASNRGIDDIRQLIESSKYKPALARYKIYIIDEVHMLSTPAFNALLKTLEEPPSYVKFVLATTDPVKLPPTILSRTIHFRFKKIGFEDVVEHLKRICDKERVSFESEALEMIARSGNGSLRDTLTLLDQAIAFCDSRLNKDGVVELLGAVNPDKIAKLIKCVTERNREEALSYVKEFSSYEAESVVDEIIEFLKSELFGKNKIIPLYALDRFFKIAAESKELLFMGADGDFTLTLAFLKMLEAMEIEDIDSLIAAYESDHKDIVSQAKVKEADRASFAQTATKNLPKEEWARLIDALYNRSFEIGKAFEQSIKFDSFENKTLTWVSQAKGEDKELLKKYYTQIKHIVQEIYGIDVSISVKKNENIADTPNKTLNGEQFLRQEGKGENAGEFCESHNKDGDENLQKNDFFIQSSLEKTVEEEAKELSLVKHPLVEKAKEAFGIGDSSVTIFQKV